MPWLSWTVPSHAITAFSYSMYIPSPRPLAYPPYSCQCGVSRSATLVIAIVMRAAATRSSLVPPEIWELRGMQAAYSFVKEKSKHVGPNMS